MISDYPVLNDLIENIQVEYVKDYEDCFASYKLLESGIKYRIRLNPQMFSETGIELRLKFTTEANYESIQDIIVHEMAHVLQHFYILRWVDKKEYSIDKYNALSNVNRKFIFALHKRKCLIRTFRTNKWVLNNLGSNAINPKEFIPECFNNYYRLKNKEPLDKCEQELFGFVSVVVNDYKKYIP